MLQLQAGLLHLPGVLAFSLLALQGNCLLHGLIGLGALGGSDFSLFGLRAQVSQGPLALAQLVAQGHHQPAQHAKGGEQCQGNFVPDVALIQDGIDQQNHSQVKERRPNRQPERTIHAQALCPGHGRAFFVFSPLLFIKIERGRNRDKAQRFHNRAHHQRGPKIKIQIPLQVHHRQRGRDERPGPGQN